MVYGISAWTSSPGAGGRDDERGGGKGARERRHLAERGVPGERFNVRGRSWKEEGGGTPHEVEDMPNAHQYGQRGVDTPECPDRVRGTRAPPKSYCPVQHHRRGAEKRERARGERAGEEALHWVP